MKKLFLFFVFFSCLANAQNSNFTTNKKLSAFLDKYDYPKNEPTIDYLTNTINLINSRDQFSRYKAEYSYGKKQKIINYCNELDEPKFVAYYAVRGADTEISIPTLYKVIVPTKGALSSTVVLADKKAEYKKLVSNFGNPFRIEPNSRGDGTGEFDGSLTYKINHHGSRVNVGFVVYWTGCLAVDVEYPEAYLKFKDEEKDREAQRNKKAGRGIDDVLK